MNGVVNTIEGNSSDKVARKSYSIGSDSFVATDTWHTKKWQRGFYVR